MRRPRAGYRLPAGSDLQQHIKGVSDDGTGMHRSACGWEGDVWLSAGKLAGHPKSFGCCFSHRVCDVYARVRCVFERERERERERELL